MKKAEQNYWFFLLAALCVLFSCTPEKNRQLGLIVGGNAPAEAEAWEALARGLEGWEVTGITLEAIGKGAVDLSRFAAVWMHQVDTVLAPEAQAAGSALRAYVEQGGKLLLDMEAVRYLPVWALESGPMQTRTDTIRDTGFGRPLGFHAFKAHPLFDGMHGGAYPWKSPADHVVRKTGFFDDALPAAPGARVIGVGWSYITFHEAEKLVWTFDRGQGQVLAIGAYTYFAPENYNRDELERLYSNALDHLLGRLGGKAYFWNYSEPGVEEAVLDHPRRALQAGGRWALPVLSIAETTAAGTDAFFDLAGRRMLLMGKEKGGVEEIWTHPFMSARDLRAGILRGDEVVWLDELQPRVTVAPELLLREYRIGQGWLREVITVAFDEPVAVVHYEFSDDLAFDGLFFEATFNARYMWPYAAEASGTIRYDYDATAQALTVEAQEGELSTILAFSCPAADVESGRYAGFERESGIRFRGRPTERLQLGAHFFFAREQMGESFNVALAAGSEGTAVLLRSFDRLAPRLDGLYMQTNAYYRELLQERLLIESPDTIFNRGYRWALARTDQMFQTTPGLGTTHMAGFGTTARGWNGRHEVSGRPGYAWYFGRDAEWSGMAVNAYGDFHWVREMLKVFARYQALNGKIFHELTTSGAVHYDAADATPLFVALAAHYLRYSGDVGLIRELWPSLQAAMDYCFSTDTDGDGLIENTNVGHGWIEGGALFGAHTEFYLAGVWAAALEGGAYLAAAVGDIDLAKYWGYLAVATHALIEEQFWDEDGEYFYNGKMADSSFMAEATVLQAVPVYFAAIPDDDKARRALAPFAHNRMTTDWGIRMIAEDNPRFNPRSYHAGMVWPLYGGWAALGEYEAGLYTSAFAHFYANLINYRYWGLGSVEETLHGSVFQPAGVCSHQCWSETMVLQPAIEGMLGLRPNAMGDWLALSPRFPLHWNRAQVRNIRMGKALLDLEMQRNDGRWTYSLHQRTGQPVRVFFTLSLPLGAEAVRVVVNGAAVEVEWDQGPESLEGTLPEQSIPADGTLVIEATFRSGFGAAPLTWLPEPGEESKGARILRQEPGNDGWAITFSGRPESAYEAKVFAAGGIRAIEGAELVGQDGDWYTLAFTMPPGTEPYVEHRVFCRLTGAE